MKKAKISQKVPPVPSDDYPIVREELEDGTIEYRHPVGWKVNTAALELDLFVGCMHERYQSLIALLDSDDYKAFGILFEAITAYNMRQLDEILEFLSRCVGKIDFHYVEIGETTYRSGRVVGMSVEPPEMVKAKMAKAQGVAR